MSTFKFHQGFPDNFGDQDQGKNFNSPLLEIEWYSLLIIGLVPVILQLFSFCHAFFFLGGGGEAQACCQGENCPFVPPPPFAGNHVYDKVQN